MKASSLLLVVASALATGELAAQPPTIGPDRASGFIGRDATVCGKVESARYNENSDGQPTFMHLGGAFPRHAFAVRVDGANRGRFSPPPEELIGRMICVSGRVAAAAGNRPEMTIEAPGEMQVL